VKFDARPFRAGHGGDGRRGAGIPDGAVHPAVPARGRPPDMGVHCAVCQGEQRGAASGPIKGLASARPFRAPIRRRAEVCAGAGGRVSAPGPSLG
jgi:hypothetical protein